MEKNTIMLVGLAMVGAFILLTFLDPFIHKTTEEISSPFMREKLIIIDIQNDDVSFYVNVKNLTENILVYSQINVKVVNPNGEEVLHNFIDENPDLELITGRYIHDKEEGLIQIRLGNIIVGKEYIIVISVLGHTIVIKYIPK